MIKAEKLAHSLNPQGQELITIKGTLPRIVLAEFNTHRMFSRNSASSRAIPFKKMVERVNENPFIPLAFQEDHKGMQGDNYITDKLKVRSATLSWINASKEATISAERLNKDLNITKQLCNRILEPFLWHEVIFTTSYEGLENFFVLRCPQYEVEGNIYRSRKDAIENHPEYSDLSYLEWMEKNQSHAEIHIQAFAEAVWDARNSSEPKQLAEGEWHIPMFR